MDIHTQSLPMERLSELLVMQMHNGGRARLTVTGYSMMPMLRNRRDTVELVAAQGQRRKGDIILYRRENGQFVLHRIIARESTGYLCCGDNQAVREPVAPEQVIAVVDAFYRNGKKYTMDNAGYRLYTAIWVGGFPLRPYYIALRRRLGRLRRRKKQGGNTYV